MFLTLTLPLFAVMHLSLGLAANPRIAIIGGGIGGTSCAYFLKQLFEKKASLTLFERDTIGGRLATIDVDGHDYESGGSVIHPKNKYLSDFAKVLGLKPRREYFGQWGIYDGKEFVFKTNPWTAVTLTRLLWRYGLSTLHLETMLNSLLTDFSRIYGAQDKGLAFTTVPNLLAYMNPKFPNMTQQTLASHLKDYGFSDLFIEELAQSVMLVNYGQTVDINAFVGSVSLAGSESGLLSIKGGNKQVPLGLLEESDTRLLNADVTAVSLQKDDTFKLTYKRKTGSIADENFDAVVVATPLMYNFKNIKFENFTEDFTKYEGVYHQTISTFVKGILNDAPFQTSHLPDVIFTNNNSFVFNSLGLTFPVSDKTVSGKHKVYKVFSKVPLTDGQIKDLFQDVKTVHSKDWLAYPHYEVPEKIPPFVLYPGLYYTSAIEWSASAMEMSAIAGKNVALLIHNAWANSDDKIDATGNIFEKKDEL